jgi:hypothetical protein
LHRLIKLNSNPVSLTEPPYGAKRRAVAPLIGSFAAAIQPAAGIQGTHQVAIVLEIVKYLNY